jgi:hypothetical protein
VYIAYISVWIKGFIKTFCSSKIIKTSEVLNIKKLGDKSIKMEYYGVIF